MVKAGIIDVYRDVTLGHTLIGMDRHYIQLKDANIIELMEKYSRWLIKEINKAEYKRKSVDQNVDQS